MMVVLHPRLMNEVKSHSYLDFDEAVKRVSGYFMTYSIFQAFANCSSYSSWERSQSSKFSTALTGNTFSWML